MIHNIYNYIFDFFKDCFTGFFGKEKEKKFTLNECLEILNKNFNLTLNEKLKN